MPLGIFNASATQLLFVFPGPPDVFSVKPVKQNLRKAKNLQAARQVPQPIFNRGDFEYTLQKAFAPTAPARVPPNRITELKIAKK